MFEVRRGNVQFGVSVKWEVVECLLCRRFCEVARWIPVLNNSA